MLDERFRALCKGENYGVLTTLFPDGSPQSQVMWIDCDDDHVIFNTETHRAKLKNLAADPRRRHHDLPAGDPTTYFEVRGTVVDTIVGPEAKAHLDSLSKRYFKLDEYPYPIQSERVIVHIAPDRVGLLSVAERPTRALQPVLGQRLGARTEGGRCRTIRGSRPTAGTRSR